TGTILDFSGCAPLWVAWQNGNSPWTRVTGTSNHFSFTVTDSRGGFAWSTGTVVSVVFATRQELATTLPMCVASGAKTLTATVNGLAASDLAILNLGGGTGSAVGGGVPGPSQ